MKEESDSNLYSDGIVPIFTFVKCKRGIYQLHVKSFKQVSYQNYELYDRVADATYELGGMKLQVMHQFQVKYLKYVKLSDKFRFWHNKLVYANIDGKILSGFHV